VSGLTKPGPALLWGLVSIMVVLWSVNPVAGKIGLQYFPAPLLVAVRTSIAGLIVLPALWRSRHLISRQDWLKLTLLGAGLQVGNQILYVNALDRTSVAHAAFIYSAVPVIILLLAASRGQERITTRKILGMSICIAGALWLASDQSGSGNPTPQGDAILVIAGLLFASFTVFGKEMRDRYGAVVLNSLAYVSGALLLQPIIWIVYSDVSLTSIPTDGWLAVAYMAIFPSVLGYLIYYWVLGHVPASKIAGVQYLQPLTATSLGWLFLGESITLTLALAGAVIMAGVYIAERR
jgi:drug/metabolite transporter (DMT)-like permease